jgi:hypothetical protein
MVKDWKFFSLDEEQDKVVHSHDFYLLLYWMF